MRQFKVLIRYARQENCINFIQTEKNKNDAALQAYCAELNTESIKYKYSIGSFACIEAINEFIGWFIIHGPFNANVFQHKMQ